VKKSFSQFSHQRWALDGREKETSSKYHYDKKEQTINAGKIVIFKIYPSKMGVNVQ